MIFQQVQVGGYDSNFSYVLGDELSKKILLIDPINPEFLLPPLKKRGWTVALLAATHGHFDHAGELKSFYEALEGKPALALHSSLWTKWGIEGAERLFLDERQIFLVGNLKVEALPTPGHERGAVCFLAEGKLMTGDTLFIDGCGRTDLPGGDVHQLYQSLYEGVGHLPPDTEIYPGHDYGSRPWDTLGHQKQSNPYLKCQSQEEFVRLRGGMKSPE